MSLILRKSTVLIIILAMSTSILLSGCFSAEKDTGNNLSKKDKNNSKPGIGIYNGQIDSSSVEVDIAQNITFLDNNGPRTFKLSEPVKINFNENNFAKIKPGSRIAFKCIKNANDQWVITNITPLSEAQIPSKYNRFNAHKTQTGDNIMGLKINSVSTKKIEWSEKYQARVIFSGKLPVSGTYIHYDDNALLEDQVAFELDKDSAEKLPELNIDNRKNWFLFTNHNEAKKKLGPMGSRGKAVIIINNFTIDYRPGTESYNYAKLLSIKKKD
ncbi:MAG: copper-binding protein [Clostridiales bacterium]|nr:copper-binding protein [Clostridiales bacterium]MCF8022308.1 copper-binding protein [Clostridiales bacterium]